MTPKNNQERPEDEALGVLDDAASLDTTGIGILGNTAQVSVTLPKDEDDDLADDGVVEGEVLADLIIDDVIEETAIGRIHAAEIVIELPAEPTDTAPAKTQEKEQLESEPAVSEPAVSEPVVSEPAVSKSASLKQAEKASAPSAPERGSLPVPAGAVAAPAAGTSTDRPSTVGAPRTQQADAVGAPLPESAARVAAKSAPVRDGIRGSAAPSASTQVKQDEEAAAAARFLARADADRAAAGRSTPTAGARIQKETSVVTSSNDSKAPRSAVPRAEVALTSKRLDDLGEASRESADLLTADRLLDPTRQHKPEPEGAWSHFLYTVSGHRINIGDSRRARERKALTAKIAAPLSGGARFVPVLSRKGGVGKTAITALLGMALADAREDRVIAVDANPDRGTLADRIVRAPHGRSVRDLVRIHDDVKGYHDISAIVTRDTTRLDVLASDPDPRIAEAFSDSDYRDVAEVAAHYYSLVLTDTGTGIVHSVMSATLDLADQIVIVSGLSVDEARLASETLTWLETNGYAAQARDAIVVLNQSTPGAPLVRLNELEAHFATRASHVVRVPYDPQIAGGGAIVFSALNPETRQAARELAALLVDGLRAKAA